MNNFIKWFDSLSSAKKLLWYIIFGITACSVGLCIIILPIILTCMFNTFVWLLLYVIPCGGLVGVGLWAEMEG